jgi:hypothetical protein
LLLSYVGIAVCLGLGAGMGNRALASWTDRLSVLPQSTRIEIVFAGLPGLVPRRYLLGRELDIKRAPFNINSDDVAVGLPPEKWSSLMYG